MAAADDIQAEMVLRDINLDRYRRKLAARALLQLAMLEEDITRRLRALDPNAVRPGFKQARLARILADVQGRIDRYGKAMEQSIMPEMLDLARDEAAFGVQMMDRLTPTVVDFATPSVNLIEAAMTATPFSGRILKDWIKDHPLQVRTKVRESIVQGVSEGRTIDDMVRRIKGTRANSFKDGIMEANRRSVETMVRTAVNHTVSVAREMTYAENADIIKGVKWVATLDSRTSPTCQALDGQVFPPKSGPRPPAHANCRSSTVPVLKSWKEMGIDRAEVDAGTRASMDGQVPANMNYSQWLRTRPAAFQDEVLGKGRADIFRSGKDLDKFVDNSGHSYTLAQLRGKSPAPKPPPLRRPPPPPVEVTDRMMRDEGWSTSGYYGDKTINDGGMDLWNKHLKYDPRRFAEEMTGSELTSMGDRTFSSKAGGNGVFTSNFTTNVYSMEGDRAGSLTRTFRRTKTGELGVHHDYFKLNEQYQGGGAGTAALANQMEAYQRMNIDVVDVHAALDKGAYVWAKFGFKPYPHEWDSLRASLVYRARSLDLKSQLRKDEYDKLQRILKNPDPYALWDLSDLTAEVTDTKGKKNKLGWALLADGPQWQGEIRLKDARAMKRFQAYISRKKTK